MNINVQKGDILETSADMLVVGIYEEENWENDFIDRLNEILGGRLEKSAKNQKFEGKVGQAMRFTLNDAEFASHLMIVGLGKLKEFQLESARNAVGIAVRTAMQLGIKTLAIELLGEDKAEFNAAEHAQAITEAAHLANYQFETYKKPKFESVNSLIIVAEDSRDAKKAEKGVEKGQIIADGVSVARDLVNTPAQDMNPVRLAQTAEKIVSMSEGMITAKIFNREECQKKKMNAYLAVAQGADAEPRFIHLTYKPKKETKKRIAVVGKGVTFDSGGLSLKPGQYMMTMKCDMAGAAATLGVFASLARLQPNVEVHGIVAATENMPSGKAIRPGDVVKASNGKTIEILNTDAEGRLTLADALHYACGLEPKYIVDMATLTGAAVVALGEEISGVMSNNAEFANRVLTASAKAGEKMWEMPLEGQYNKLLESEIADLRNIATVRYGGSLTAGLFLQNFISEEVKWAHIDIAGPAFAERDLTTYLGKGGTGHGVRTVLELIQSL